MKSSIGGSVEAHVAAVGQRVEIGSALLTLECMKMLLVVEASVGGTVAWMRPCGEVVEVDDVVAVLDV